MKHQTFISYLKDKDDRIIDFDRWTYKRLSTVRRKLKEFYTAYNGVGASIIKKQLEQTKTIEIYATPDGLNPGKKPALVLTKDNLVLI